MNKKELAQILNDPIAKLNLYNVVNLKFDDESEFNQQDYSRFIFRNAWYMMFLEDPKKMEEKLGSDGRF